MPYSTGEERLFIGGWPKAENAKGDPAIVWRIPGGIGAAGRPVARQAVGPHVWPVPSQVGTIVLRAPVIQAPSHLY